MHQYVKPEKRDVSEVFKSCLNVTLFVFWKL